METENSVGTGRIPLHIALQMQDTIRATIENTIKRTELETGYVMDASFVETLPWIDYNEVLQRVEERGKEEGINIGKAEGKIEIALNAFRRARPDSVQVVELLRDLGVPDDIIGEARNRAETERVEKLREKKRGDRER